MTEESAKPQHLVWTSLYGAEMFSGCIYERHKSVNIVLLTLAAVEMWLTSIMPQANRPTFILFKLNK